MRNDLNSYQKTMLQWNGMNPYNSVHVLHVGEAPDLERLRLAVNKTLHAHGLTEISLDRSRWTYFYHADPARYEIKVISEENPQATLISEIERQLDSLFPDIGRFQPFRFFVLPEKDGFYLGLAVFHAIADAQSVALLLKDILENYTGAVVGPSQVFDLYPDGRDSLLRRPVLLARKLASLSSLIRNMSASCRVPYTDVDALRIRVSFLSLKPEKLEILLKAARALDVTVNDLLIAIAMKCMVPICINHLMRNRRKISFGCVVNTRNDLGLVDQRKFGLFLGSFTVTHTIPNKTDIAELAKDIRRQTLAIKKHRLYMASQIEMALGRFVYSVFPGKNKKKFYSKFYPLWGGVTNMNLNSLWSDRQCKIPVDYFRAVSPGPVNQLVFSVTTLGSVMNIGLVCRAAVFSRLKIDKWKTSFLETLEQIA